MALAEAVKDALARPPDSGSAPVGTDSRDLRECGASDDMTMIFLTMGTADFVLVAVVAAPCSLDRFPSMQLMC